MKRVLRSLLVYFIVILMFAPVNILVFAGVAALARGFLAIVSLIVLFGLGYLWVYLPARRIKEHGHDTGQPATKRQQTFMGIISAMSLMNTAALAWMSYTADVSAFILLSLTACLVAALSARRLVGRIHFLLAIPVILPALFFLKEFALPSILFLLALHISPRLSLKLTFIPVFSSLIVCFCLSLFVVSMRESTMDHRDEILRQAGVSTIFVVDENEEWNSDVWEPRFVVEDCEGEYYLAGFWNLGKGSGNNNSLFRINKRNLKSRTPITGTQPSSDLAGFDCARKLMFFNNFENGNIRILSLKDDSIVFKKNLRDFIITSSIVDAENSRVFYGSTESRKIVVLDYSDLKHPKTKVLAETKAEDMDFMRGKLYIAGKRWLKIISPETGKTLAETRLTIGPNPMITVNEKENVVYVTNFFTGYMHAYKGDNLSPAGRTWLSPDIYLADFSPYSGRVFVSNWLSGQVFSVDTKTMKLNRVFNCGRRARVFHFSRDGKALLVTTMGGAFRVEL